MKKLILFFALVLFLVQTKAQYTSKDAVIQSINTNVKRAPAVPLRGDTLNAILNGIMSFAGGSSTPFLFGINDTVMGQNRYLNMSNGKQFYFDFDGDSLAHNYVQIGYGGNAALHKSFDVFFKDDNTWTENTQNNLAVGLFSGIGVNNSFAQFYAHDTIADVSGFSGNDKTSLQISAYSATLSRPSDNIAKNIITSINSQLADISGNINTPNFTIAQRNALPIPSAGFTAFITDAIANDASVGVNQSWNGMTWKNNW